MRQRLPLYFNGKHEMNAQRRNTLLKFKQLPHEFSVLRKTIHIFNSQAQTLSDHTLFPDSSPYKCATVRSSDVVLRGRCICSSKRKLQKNRNLQRLAEKASSKPENIYERIASET